MATTEQHIQLLEKRLADQPTSPLFAQLASYYLEAGRTQEALALCERGLSQHPFYPTGHLIKGKVLVSLSMNAEARREMEFVQEFFPGNKTIADLIAQIPVDEDVDVLSPRQETEVALPSFAPEQNEAETPFTPQATDVESPATTEEVSPFDQLQASSEFETSTPSVVETAAPEDAFAQLTPSETPATDGFGTTTEQQEESPFSALEMLNQPAATEETPSPFGEVTESPQEVESPFAALESPAAETLPIGETEEVPSPFGSVEETPAQPETPTFETSFGEVAPPSEEESFERYAARMRRELAGQEDSITLDEYLGDGASGTVQETIETQPEPAPPQPSEAEKTEIEEIAEKLRTAKKITPVINIAERTARPASEAETPAATGFVTPTLAEIYAKQGWFDDAIKAYKTLMVTKPSDRERFEKRIAELEEQKAQQSG